MPKHIGIVGVSAEGAALCYRTVCVEGASILGRHAHPEVTMHTYPLSDYMRHIEAGRWDKVASMLLDSAEKLRLAGADLLICPDNTAHEAIDLIRDRSPLPWLHIAEEVAYEAKRKGFKKVGLTGTKYLIEGTVYPSKFMAVNVKLAIPNASQRNRINEIIFNELVKGQFLPKSLEYFQQVIVDFKQQGCDAVALSCTEIPLLIPERASPLPTLDSTRVLARAALHRAANTAQHMSAMDRPVV